MTSDRSISRRIRLGIALVAALTVSAVGFAATADANPAPYWGQINQASYVEKAYGWTGADCTMAIGSHNTQSIYPSNGRAQAAGTFVCDGTRYHNLYVRVQYYALNGSSWYLASSSSWYYWANTRYGMGYTTTLYSPPSCAPSFLPTSTRWLARIEFYLDGYYGHVDTPGVKTWLGGPNRC
jgi:hypothetical protein